MSAFLQKAFGFKPGEHRARTEVVAGITTFLTMAYVLAVNPSIFSPLAEKGLPTGAVFTVTALTAMIGTLMMAVIAKRPFAMGPGMGMNAFFVYTVCLEMGYDWHFALTAVLLEGIVMLLLFTTKARDVIVNAIPPSLKAAICCGIGLYLSFIGLKNAGVVVAGDALVGLGNVTSNACLLFFISLALTSALLILNVKGAILIGILATTFLGIPMGVTHLHGVISMPESIAPTFMAFDWKGILSLDMLVLVITFLCIDVFSIIGSNIGVGTKAGMATPDGKVHGLGKMLISNALGSTLGACLGSSTSCIYSESASGILAGGKSGLTAFTVVVCFFFALFFSPFFLAIPAAATGAVMVIVGVMMMSGVTSIDWDDYSEAIPAFLSMALMPMTASIADGILIGMLSYVLINALSKRFHKITPAMWVLAVLFVLRYVFL